MRRALQIRERSPESPRTLLAGSLNGLGNVCGATGRYTEAEAYLRRALRIREELQEAGQAYLVALSLHNLASLLVDRGNLDEAERLARRSLALYEKTLGPEDLETAGSLRLCARIARLRGRYDEADALAQRVLAIPMKRFDRNAVSHLTREQMQAILDAPGAATLAGQRDRLRCTTPAHGCRRSPICRYRTCDWSRVHASTLLAKAAKSGPCRCGKKRQSYSDSGFSELR